MSLSGRIGYTPAGGQTTPQTTPLGRRETIRDSLQNGDWQTAALHLHRAYTAREWLYCGLRSHRAYVETIPISRTYDWHLRLIAATDQARVANTFRQARSIALRARLAATELPPQNLGDTSLTDASRMSDVA